MIDGECQEIVIDRSKALSFAKAMRKLFASDDPKYRRILPSSRKYHKVTVTFFDDNPTEPATLVDGIRTEPITLTEFSKIGVPIQMFDRLEFMTNRDPEENEVEISTFYMKFSNSEVRVNLG